MDDTRGVPGPKVRSPLDRFWPKVDQDGPVPDHAPHLGACWLWTGSVSTGGYARLGVDGSPLYAHRLSYAWFVGPLIDGLQIDHLCRVRRCVNPLHLEQVTAQENMHRGKSPGMLLFLAKTCVRGHVVDGENLYISPEGRRSCRACTKIRQHPTHKGEQ